ncbi:peptide deformylase [Paracoccus sp. p3-h83]
MPTVPGAVTRAIVTYPDDRLRAVCAPVGVVDAEIRQLVIDMLATMYAAPGRGLAAPQVGVLKRLFVIDVTWRDGAPDPMICIDPELSDPSDVMVAREEGCLSIPDHPVIVTRPDAVSLTYTDVTGQRLTRRLTGIAATCAQHEFDHLNGVLILDHESPA